MKLRNFLFLFCLTAFFCVSSSSFAFQPTLHTVTFTPYTYFPNSLSFEVGDTIVWKGDFVTYPLESTSVPVGADPFGPINSGSSFQYVVQVAGSYTYQNKTYASLGMKGSFSAVFKPHGSIN